MKRHRSMQFLFIEKNERGVKQLRRESLYIVTESESESESTFHEQQDISEYRHESPG